MMSAIGILAYLLCGAGVLWLGTRLAGPPGGDGVALAVVLTWPIWLGGIVLWQVAVLAPRCAAAIVAHADRARLDRTYPTASTGEPTETTDGH